MFHMLLSFLDLFGPFVLAMEIWRSRSQMSNLCWGRLISCLFPAESVTATKDHFSMIPSVWEFWGINTSLKKQLHIEKENAVIPL